MKNIGFIQGRLSELVANKIQAFPWKYWRDEFELANRFSFELMEWTLDDENLYQNPLMTGAGRDEIKRLCTSYKININSVTGDCFMQNPFWKMEDHNREDALKDMANIIESMGDLGIKYLVVPLVDNGSLENDKQIDNLLSGLEMNFNLMKKFNVVIVFESDYHPEQLSKLISMLDASIYGINYDIGNSAALGFDAAEEISSYGARIYNVHVKDRILGGTTVPLGQGNANLEKVFQLLSNINYQGNFILQTARAKDGDHAGALCKYRDMVQHYISST